MPHGKKYKHGYTLRQHRAYMATGGFKRKPRRVRRKRRG